jgi:tryptophan-rich sensory protein
MPTAPASAASSSGRRSTGGSGWLALIVSVGVTGAAAGLAARSSVTSAAFYAQLDKPAWAPPPWLFGPVWSALYLLMAVAAWRTWRAAGRTARGALALYGGQLVLNALWTWLFFEQHVGLWATVEVVALWAAILATLLAFRRHDRPAALLLVPYLAWVSFASALTIAVWQRNPTLL